MNAKQLLDFLLELEQSADLSKVEVNFRENYDADVYKVNYFEEDLFDEQTNNLLTSIVLMADNSDV